MINRNGINKTRKNEPMMMAMLHLETATLSLSFFCCFACSSRLFKFNSHQHRHCKGPKNLQKISDRCEAKISKQKNFFVWRLKEKKVSLCIERRWGLREEDENKHAKQERISNWQFARLSGWLSGGFRQQFIISFTYLSRFPFSSGFGRERDTWVDNAE